MKKLFHGLKTVFHENEYSHKWVDWFKVIIHVLLWVFAILFVVAAFGVVGAFTYRWGFLTALLAGIGVLILGLLFIVLNYILSMILLNFFTNIQSIREAVCVTGTPAPAPAETAAPDPVPEVKPVPEPAPACEAKEEAPSDPVPEEE